MTLPALTFDDGPGEQTERLLDILARHGVRATLFVVGAHVARRPDVVARAAAEGHVIGNHSYEHPCLTDLHEEAIASQLRRTSEEIERATGRRPSVFRPPYGARDERVDHAARALGMRTLMWSVDPRDWSEPGVAAILAVLAGAGPRDVVLLHDGRGERSQTVEAVHRYLGQWPQHRAAPV